MTLALGGLYVLYLTGLYQAAERDSVIHAAVHLHMFLAGCLLSWAVIGIDPIRRRPGTGGRLAALFIATAGHDTLAKLMYAWMLPAGGGPAAGRRLEAELMYYGSTAIDVALAVILMTQWTSPPAGPWPGPDGDQPSPDRDAEVAMGRRSLRPNTSAPAISARRGGRRAGERGPEGGTAR